MISRQGGQGRQIFHVLGVYPPWSEKMEEPGNDLLALSFQLAITVVAGVIALRVAGYAPGQHAIALGAIGLALGTTGALSTTTGGADMGSDC